MKTRDYTKNTGRIKTFKIQDELELLSTLTESKPYKKIIMKKKGRKAINALESIEKNNNHSWYEEIRIRSNRQPNATALFYRGNKITFEEMMKKADEVAKSLASIGITKGDEIPCCLSNTPELVYILLAANKLGAKVNLFGTHLNSEYLKNVLANCSSKIFIGTDDTYLDIKDIVDESNISKKLIVSLADSLPEDPKKSDEYEEQLDKYYHYDNKVKDFQIQNKSILSFSEFIELGNNYKDTIIDDNNLDTEFLVTYTSGSTIIGLPSQIIHKNRSLITSGRFHDSELSGNPEIKGLRGLAHIHTESNTDVITAISDNLMQNWSVALEPEYDKNKALDYVIINHPSYFNATTSFLITMAKQYLIEKKYHENGVGKKLPYLLATFAVGEGVSKGEEKFINKFLRESRAGSGVKISGFSLPYTTLSIGGGDCEHGGIYYTLWKSLFEKLNCLKLKKREYGLTPEPFAQVSAFKKLDNGLYEECNYNEYGLIAANSYSTMDGYKNDPDKTYNILITDTNGRDWVSSNIIGYIDELGGVHVKGRVGKYAKYENGMVIPDFAFEDIACIDTKNILSCTATRYNKDGLIYPILNIEFQPECKHDKKIILTSIQKRCEKNFGEDIGNRILFRIMDNKKSYPLTGSGKRNITAIDEMGIENTICINNKVNLNVKEKQKVRK